MSLKEKLWNALGDSGCVIGPVSKTADEYSADWLTNLDKTPFDRLYVVPCERIWAYRMLPHKLAKHSYADAMETLTPRSCMDRKKTGLIIASLDHILPKEDEDDDDDDDDDDDSEDEYPRAGWFEPQYEQDETEFLAQFGNKVQKWVVNDKVKDIKEPKAKRAKKR